MSEIRNYYADLLEENRRLRKAYENAQATGRIYTHLAHALAQDYTDLFYVNMYTDEYIEYLTDNDRGVLIESRRGADFFESCKREAKIFVHPDNQTAFVNAMNRDFLVRELDRSGVFVMTYRRIKNGRTFYVHMKVSRAEDDKRIIVIAVSDVDELVKKRCAEERIQEERIVYARLHALTGNFIVVFVVDPETDDYREFSSAENYSSTFAPLRKGHNFFDDVRNSALQHTNPDDLNRFLTVFTKQNVLNEIKRSGIFTFSYRFMMNQRSLHVQLKAAMVEEKEGPRLIVGLNDIDVQVRQAQEIGKRLIQAESQVNIDALTGIKNRHAYLVAESRLDQQIVDHSIAPFSIAIMDINDLKLINDTDGHQAGDQYIRKACKLICDTFKHSPVFRIGGDEFAVIVQGSDYATRQQRLAELRTHNAEALSTGGIVIACGMADFNNDPCVATVFERADHNMYENKRLLKS